MFVFERHHEAEQRMISIGIKLFVAKPKVESNTRVYTYNQTPKKEGVGEGIL